MDSFAIFFWGNIGDLLRNPLGLLFFVFVLWMLVDAIQREEWLWVIFIVLFPILNAPLYYFFSYRHRGGGGAGTLFLGGADRKRIQELKQQIHHLDKAHMHLELADIYLRQKKVNMAEEHYLAALEREPDDVDAKAHYGRCLMHQKRFGEARRFLEDVCIEDPKHDYGASLIALGECEIELGGKEAAIKIFEEAIENNSYAEPRVRLAELYLESGDQEKGDRARQLVEDVLREETLTPAYQRKQEAEWTHRARKLLSLMSRN